MRVRVVVTLPMIVRVLMRMRMAGGVGMGVHRYLVHSTALPGAAHLRLLSRYWKL